MKFTRRSFLQTTGIAALATQWRPAFAAPVKVAGIHTVPVENAWNSRLHSPTSNAGSSNCSPVQGRTKAPTPRKARRLLLRVRTFFVKVEIHPRIPRNIRSFHGFVTRGYDAAAFR